MALYHCCKWHCIISACRCKLKLFINDRSDFIIYFVGLAKDTVNSEIFTRILVSRKAFKDTFDTLEIRDFGMIYLNQ